MAVPKRKTSKSRRDSRRSHIKCIKDVNVVPQQVTGEYTLPHHISPDGYYGDRKVINVKKKKA